MMVARHAQPVTAISRADGSAAQTETYPAPIGVVLVGGESLYREGVKASLTAISLSSWVNTKLWTA